MDPLPFVTTGAGRDVVQCLYTSQSSWHRSRGLHYWGLLRSLQALQISTRCEIKSGHSSSSQCISLEQQECRFLLSGGADASVVLFDLDRDDGPAGGTAAPTHVTSMVQRRQHSFSLSSVQWYPADTGAFLTSSLDGKVLMWDTNDFRVAYEFQLGQSHKKVYYARFHPDMAFTSLICCGLDDNSIRLCDARTGDCSQTLLGHNRGVTRAEWSPIDVHMLASASYDGSVKLWDIRKAGTAAAIMSFDWMQDHTASVRPASQLPGEQKVNNYRSYGSDLGRSEIRRMDWRKEQACKAHEAAVMSLCFTPGGRHLVSSGNDRRTRLWHVASGDLVAVNYATWCSSDIPYDIKVVEVSGSLDDVLVAPGSSGEVTLTAVHCSTGGPFHRLAGHLGMVHGIACRSRDNALVTASRDGLIHLWEGLVGGAVDEDDWSDNEVAVPQAEEGDVAACLRCYIPPIIRQYLEDYESSRVSLLAESDLLLEEEELLPPGSAAAVAAAPPPPTIERTRIRLTIPQSKQIRDFATASDLTKKRKRS